MATTTPIAILSVDDNPMMADAIRLLAHSTAELKHVSHHFSGAGVLDAVRSNSPAVVLMDLDIPGTNTIELVQQICQTAPNTFVLMLSGHLHPHTINQCIEAGAMGYMHKSRTPSQLIDAIRRIAGGEFVMCEEAARLAYFED